MVSIRRRKLLALYPGIQVTLDNETIAIRGIAFLGALSIMNYDRLCLSLVFSFTSSEALFVNLTWIVDMILVGQNSLLAPLSRVFEHGCTATNWGESKKPVSVHPLPLNDGCTPKEENTLEIDHGSPDLVASAPSKQHLFQKFPEVKRRKRHRRKRVENQEACTMRGVYYKNRKWQAAIKVDKKQIHLGTVSSEEEAARLYDRAAFMCGREPNFELSEEEKHELRQYKWDEFLAITRSAITTKKGQRVAGPDSRRKLQHDEWEGEHGNSSFSGSEDDMLAP